MTTEEQANPKVKDAQVSFAKNRILRRLLLLPLVVIAGLYFLSMTAAKPDNLGVTNGGLAECPESPNCVSTQTARATHRLEPIPYEGSTIQMIQKIKSCVGDNFSRVRLITEKENYLHFEFKSLIFRFVDDVEFLVDPENSVVHFRSASRVGHSDLGANRKRMNLISEKLKQ